MGTLALDSSALLAVLLHEPDADAMLASMSAAERLLLSALNYAETGMVWDNQVAGPANPADLDRLISIVGAEIVPVNQHTAQLARTAYRYFGKGRHPAGLNICDCFAYALAKEHNIPLLFKGGDFAKTDIAPALP